MTMRNGLAALALMLGASAAHAATPPAPKAEGERLYAYHCAPCHAEGTGHPGTQALQLKYNGQMPALLTQRRDLTPDTLHYFIRNGVNAMPYFRKTEISDAAILAIAGFLTKPSKPTRSRR